MVLRNEIGPTSKTSDIFSDFISGRRNIKDGVLYVNTHSVLHVHGVPVFVRLKDGVFYTPNESACESHFDNDCFLVRNTVISEIHNTKKVKRCSYGDFSVILAGVRAGRILSDSDAIVELI